jgi:hypothetical protein
MEKENDLPVGQKHVDARDPSNERQERPFTLDRKRFGIAFLLISCIWLSHSYGLVYRRTTGCGSGLDAFERATHILKKNPLIGWSSEQII